MTYIYQCTILLFCQYATPITISSLSFLDNRLISNYRNYIFYFLGIITDKYQIAIYPMGKTKSKSDLPTKICPVCNRPFHWRKRWAKCWDEVKYCSERCRRRRSFQLLAPPN
jgi:hypothetical protein